MWSSTLYRLTPAVRRMLAHRKPSTWSWRFPRLSAWSRTSRNARRHGPLAACLLLLVLVAAQLSWPAAERPDVVASAPPPSAASPTAAPGPWTELTQRPLFSPTRRPGPPREDGPSSLDGMVVLGIALADRATSAVIKLPSGRIVRVQQGQGVEGWIMASVEPLRLVFEKEGATRAIPLEAKKLRPAPTAKRARP